MRLLKIDSQFPLGNVDKQTLLKRLNTVSFEDSRKVVSVEFLYELVNNYVDFST